MVARLIVAAAYVAIGAVGCGNGGGQVRQADASHLDGVPSAVGCVGEGETLIGAAGETCCAGLTTVACSSPLTLPDASPGTSGCLAALFQCSVCVQKCGDGKCTLGENECNCAQDCDPEATQLGCHADDVPFDAPSGYWAWALEGTTTATPDPNVNCCKLASRVYAYDDTCKDTLVYPTHLICLANCRDGKCEAPETPCSCPWDCITDSAGCYVVGDIYNPPGTGIILAPADGASSATGGCCPGLSPAPDSWLAPDGSCASDQFGAVRCLPCGDGICAAGESVCNCPADCH